MRGWIVVSALLLPVPVARAGAPLADAAEKRDGAGIRALLTQGADIEAAQPDGMRALHWAAYHDDVETARALVAAKAHVDERTSYGITPLSLACVNGSDAMVGLLLDAGADPNSPLRGGETPLMIASRTGRIGPVKRLLEKGAKPDAAERQGQTAVMWAAAEGHAPVVEALIAAGADWRKALPSGFNAMFFAVREGRAEVVRVLREAGADVNEAMVVKERPGRGAVSGTSPLVMAVENGHFELAAALLDAGADPNDQRSGVSPLHLLVHVRKPPRGDDEDGDPPPTGSGRMNSLELVDRLIAHGADVNLRLKRGAPSPGKLTRKGATPFLLACQSGDLPLIRKLLDHGADPKLPNARHSTPLMAAAGLGSVNPDEEPATENEALDAVSLLLALGNDINAVDDDGETVMHGAAYKQFPRVVALLAARGARPEVWNRKNGNGWTPLAIAEGHRIGNFKPSPETIAAIRGVLSSVGVTPASAETPGADRRAYP